MWTEALRLLNEWTPSWLLMVVAPPMSEKNGVKSTVLPAGNSPPFCSRIALRPASVSLIPASAR